MLLYIPLLLLTLLASCTGLAGEPEIVATISPTSTPLIPPESTPSLVLGQQIYAQHCTRCHGLTGKGDGEFVQSGQITAQMIDFTLPQANDHVTPPEWFEVITNGRIEALMPPWGETLTETERWAVTMYVYSLADTAQENPSLAEAPESIGTVTGRVIHGTSGGVLPEGLIAELHTFDSAMNDVAVEVPVNPDGTYTFENVTFDAAHNFVISVIYQGGSFVSELAAGDSSFTTLDLPVTVYDLTYDSAVVRINSIAMQIYQHENTLQFIQIMELWNDSDRIYMGTSADDDFGNLTQTVSLSLPENARYVDLTGEGRYNLSPDGRQLIDSQPVLPGEPHTVHLTYTLPYDDSIEVIQPLDYPLEGSVEIRVSTPALDIASDAFSPLGSVTKGTTTFHLYGASVSLPAGSPFTFEVVENTAFVTGSVDNSRTLLAGALVTLGVGMVMGASLLFWRDRQQKASTPLETIESLMRQIAEMDIRYQAGELNEKAYHRQRSRLKAKAAALIKKQKST